MYCHWLPDNSCRYRLRISRGFWSSLGSFPLFPFILSCDILTRTPLHLTFLHCEYFFFHIRAASDANLLHNVLLSKGLSLHRSVPNTAKTSCYAALCATTLMFRAWSGVARGLHIPNSSPLSGITPLPTTSATYNHQTHLHDTSQKQQTPYEPTVDGFHHGDAPSEAKRLAGNCHVVQISPTHSSATLKPRRIPALLLCAEYKRLRTRYQIPFWAAFRLAHIGFPAPITTPTTTTTTTLTTKVTLGDPNTNSPLPRQEECRRAPSKRLRANTITPSPPPAIGFTTNQ